MCLSAQEELIMDGSFEEDTLSHYWKGCNFNTSPDHQPKKMGVNIPPALGNGDRYISLVARDDNTREDIGQRLVEPLEPGKLYSMQLCLAFSDNYISSFKNPIVLKIWLGRDSCGKDELVWKSELIDHEKWKVYDFLLTTSLGDKMSFIYFEAGYASTSAYDGNILLDNISLIELDQNCDFQFPNAFTPDEDGLNDTFQAVGTCHVANYRLLVVDRWGKKVFETRNYRHGWNGRIRGRPAPPDTYGWFVTYQRYLQGNQRKEVKRGSLTLLR